MRTRMATAVGSPTASTLAIKSSRSARSLCRRMAATSALSSSRRQGLEAGDVLAKLLDERQMLGKRRQTRIGPGMDLLGRRRAGSDQGGIDLVVLGPLQVKLGIGAHLRRLKHDDDKTIAPQLCDHRLLVAAARLDPDPLDAMTPQPSR